MPGEVPLQIGPVVVDSRLWGELDLEEAVLQEASHVYHAKPNLVHSTFFSSSAGF